MYLTQLKTTAGNSIRSTILAAISILIISGCSSFGGTKPITVSSKPIDIQIIQPQMPRGIDLEDIKWHVVSTAPIANPCVKDAESGKREKNEDGSCKNGKENPDWPEGYSYLDRFLEENAEQNNGDIVFMAISIGDYEIMSGNMQELRRYIREVQEVVVYYRNVTINDKPAVGAKVQLKD
jgi:hypothetical protein